MARQKHKLTAKQVQHAQPGRHGDGAGLSLLVKPSGARSWVVRMTVDGKRRDIGIGAWPTVSLSEARQRNAEMQAEARGGGDPSHRPGRVPTFAEAAAAVHAAKLPTWRNPRTGREWIASLERHAFPTLGRVPVHRITPADVLGVLTRDVEGGAFWTAQHETASNVRARMGQVFRWAMAYGHITMNPAGEAISGALPAQPPKRGAHRALDWADVPAAVAAIDASTVADAVKLCLRFTILTAARGNEARGALWSEIDFDAGLWTLPAERMKSGHPHTVPLSPQAIDTLRKAEALADGSPLVFPSPAKPGHALTWTPALRLLRGLGFDTTVHGFRSCFRTWALEQPGVSWAAAEMSLAHATGSQTERAYIRSDLLAQRAALMAAWADFATGTR